MGQWGVAAQRCVWDSGEWLHRGVCGTVGIVKLGTRRLSTPSERALFELQNATFLLEVDLPSLHDQLWLVNYLA